jgi:hypothetical protein
MKPELFGRGSWYFIFKIFFYYMNKEKQILELFTLIKSNNCYDEKLDSIRKALLNDNSTFSYNYILKTNLEELNKVLKLYNVESLKKRLNIIINSLPCEECRQHALKHMQVNNIFNSDCFFYIFHFFLELRNKFYDNKIDRRLFNTKQDFNKNETLFFSKIINTKL